MDPDRWHMDHLFLDRPGNDAIQLQLFRDYPNNIDGYPALHAYFAKSQVPLLALESSLDSITAGLRQSGRA